MKITKAKEFISSFRTGIITGMSKNVIDSVVGFKGKKIKSGDGKVTIEWQFQADGVDCAIWDYKGSAKYAQYSAYMPASIGRALFAAAYDPESDYEANCFKACP
jgi:hypothetical protein